MPWTLAAIMVLLAIPITIVARQVQEVMEVAHVPLPGRPMVALDALALHLRHIAWPVDLVADYGRTPAELFASPRRWWTWLVPLLLAVVIGRTRDRVLIGGGLLAVIALAPNLGLAPFQFQVYSTVADRYAYPAMLGIAIVLARLAMLADQRSARPIASALLLATLIVALLPVTVRRCADWHDARSLWTRVLRVNSSSSLAHNNLGSMLMAGGDLDGAVGHFEAAAAQRGAAEGFALLNLAQLNLQRRDAEGAADAAARLIESYRRRGDFDPTLERMTADRLAREIARLDPAAADHFRQRLSDPQAR
jgi:tetratricopeptide (TPR) repeat protein